MTKESQDTRGRVRTKSIRENREGGVKKGGAKRGSGQGKGLENFK